MPADWQETRGFQGVSSLCLLSRSCTSERSQLDEIQDMLSQGALSQGVRSTTARPCSRSAETETWSCTITHTPSIRLKHAVQRNQKSLAAKPAPRRISSPEPRAGQTIRPGLDVARDGTLTLAPFAARGLLLL